MPVSGSITIQFVSVPYITADVLPDSPVDGTMVMLTAESKRRLYRYDAATTTWVLMADYTGMDAKIAEIAAGTVDNDDFNEIMGAKAAIIAVASQQTLLDNLAAAMGFGPEGLTITSLGGKFYMVLGVQALEFRKKTETGYITVTTFGNIKTITSASLQIGQDGEAANQYIGGLAIMAAASNGDIDFRKR